MRLRPLAGPLLLLLVACSKQPAPQQCSTPPTPKSPQGAACSAASDCATGFCLDQVCCAAQCGATEVCNDLQHVGVCFGRALGATCTGDGQCPSGHCEDGVCCSAHCGLGESCNTPGDLGQCHGKALGEACNGDTQCPSGHCVDGVCCDAACVGPCLSCALPGLAGHCQVAPDGEDPRRACGACEGCFAGLCSTALPGTDPNGACGAGQTCSALQACATATGGACSQDSDCAQSSCLGGLCLPLYEERIFAAPMNSGATFRNPEALVRAGGDRLFALFTESTLDGPYDPYAQNPPTLLQATLYLGTPNPGGGWVVHALQSDSCTDYFGYTPSALVPQGAGAYAIAYSQVVTMGWGCSPSPAGVPPGVYGIPVGPGGDPGAYERIDPDVKSPKGLTAGLKPDGTVLAAFANQDPSGDDGGVLLEVWERTWAPDGGHAWQSDQVWSTDVDSVAVAQGPEPVVVWVDRDGGYYGAPTYLMGRRPGDAAPTPAPPGALGGCCTYPYVQPAGSAPGAPGTFLVACACSAPNNIESFYLGQVSAADGGLSWRFQAPPDAGYVGSLSALGLPDGGAAYAEEDSSGYALSLELSGVAGAHQLTEAGAGRELRPDPPLAPGRPGELLILLGRVQTSAGATPDLSLLHLGP